MSIPPIPSTVSWRDGMVLEPAHFQDTDRRTASLAHIAALAGELWPWGFLAHRLDVTALASNRLTIACEGIFPGGTLFREAGLSIELEKGKEGDRANFYIAKDVDRDVVTLQAGDETATVTTLPVARLAYHADVWGELQDWSPPALLVAPGHAMRDDLNQQLGSLAALGAGFMATLRLPGAEDRKVGHVLGQVASALIQGVGIIEALLVAPGVSPGRIGIEALRLALAVRSAAGIFGALEEPWDPCDQRGSIRRLLYAAESAASGIGLPFRASLFQSTDDSDMLLARQMPADALTLAIEATRPADLMAARSWFEGAALAAPDRVQEALTRRVAGCSRHRIERDARIGVASGPLLALYSVDPDMAWRGSSAELALAAKTAPPTNVSFAVFIPETGDGDAPPPMRRDRPEWSPASAPDLPRGAWNGLPRRG